MSVVRLRQVKSNEILNRLREYRVSFLLSCTAMAVLIRLFLSRDFFLAGLQLKALLRDASFEK